MVGHKIGFMWQDRCNKEMGLIDEIKGARWFRGLILQKMDGKFSREMVPHNSPLKSFFPKNPKDIRNIGQSKNYFSEYNGQQT